MSPAPTQRTRARGAKPEAAQDVVFAWLKKHVVSLPRTDGTFLTEAEVCRATGMSRTPVREALLADRLGADVVWLAEHHFDGISVYGDPMVLAGLRERWRSPPSSRPRPAGWLSTVR